MQQSVGWIELFGHCLALTAESVGACEDQTLDETFELPAVVSKIVGQQVEQFRMRRRFTEDAEVV